MAGVDSEKVDEMGAQADAIQEAILDNMWSEEMRMFLAKTSHGATAARSSDGGENPLSEDEADFVPVKESNLYNIYAQNLIPKDEWEKYVDGFRFMRYGDNFPIFPFYTANQYDRSKFGIGGSNNFSNINFTVQYRGVRSALRHYDPQHQYVTEDYAARLLDWMDWGLSLDGDLRTPIQAEYGASSKHESKSYQRDTPNHAILANINYISIEYMGGILPLTDELVELWPIDLDYEAFMDNI